MIAGLDIRSSWIVADGYASRIGEPRTKLGASSPQRQRVRERVARFGVTSADAMRRVADDGELAEFRDLMKRRGIKAVRCGACGEPGHNVRTCPTAGTEMDLRSKSEQ